VFVRDPAATARHSGLHTVRGDVHDRAAVSSAINGQDAVLSALGPRSLTECGLLASAMANIVAAIMEHGVRRIIVLGAAGALHDGSKYQSATIKAIYWITKHTLLKNPLSDQAAQEHDALAVVVGARRKGAVSASTPLLIGSGLALFLALCSGRMRRPRNRAL